MTIRAPFLPFILLALLSACTLPQSTGTIAFSSDRDGKAEIYILNPDDLHYRQPEKTT